MGEKYYTIDEVQNMKFRELPNFLYNAILKDISANIGFMNSRIEAMLDDAVISELDQYCNPWIYIILL